MSFSKIVSNLLWDLSHKDHIVGRESKGNPNLHRFSPWGDVEHESHSLCRKASSFQTSISLVP